MSDPKPTRPPLEWWNEESASPAFCIETGEIQMWFRYTIHLEAELAQRDNLNVKCGQLHDCYREVCAERDAALARAHCAELMMQEELDKAGEAYCAALARANAAEASREEYARRVASAAVRDTIERVAGGYTHTEGNAEWVELRVTRALAECTPEPLPEPSEPAGER